MLVAVVRYDRVFAPCSFLRARLILLEQIANALNPKYQIEKKIDTWEKLPRRMTSMPVCGVMSGYMLYQADWSDLQ